MPSPAVLRAGDVLDHLIRHPTDSFTVSEVARAVGVPRATCDSILQALAEKHFVTRNAERRYELGPGSIALGEAARLANPSLGAAKVEAELLARTLHACVSVCVHDGRTARVVESFDFGPIFAVRARVGQAIPLVPPFGAVFVAWSDEDAERWIARAGDLLDAGERERYRRALEAVRRRGYSVSIAVPGPTIPETVETLARSPDSDDAERARDELIRQAMHSAYLPVELDAEKPLRVGQISAPVFDREGAVAASLLVPGPDRDIHAAELRSLAGRLLEAATRATRAAVGREPAISPA
ncbi:MAG TPA: helix-turn-helix domain-containing protein [Myxococcota bacterium]|nr:helix-turn-helix domain-containing protein [Myxococcota bacterium]